MNLRLWEMLRACQVKGEKFQPHILGRRVSVPTWSKLLGVSLNRVYRLTRHLNKGHCSMPTAKAAGKADAWLTYIYTCFAEPLAEARVVDYDESAPPAPPQEESESLVHMLTSAKEWVWGPTCSKAGTAGLSRNERSLPWMSFQELYNLHVRTCQDDPVSKSMLVRAWRTYGWNKVLKFRANGTHSKCETCCRLREWKRSCTTEADRLRVAEALERHTARIMLDRAVDNRCNEVAARCMTQDALGVSGDWGPHGSMTIDGMDQSKFSVPRWSPAARCSKEFETQWRPNLHVHGTLVFGAIETFYICDLDVAKNANLQCTVMARSLQLCHEELTRRGVSMPRGWRFQYDNTAAEGNNKTCFTFYALLCGIGVFDVIDGTSFEVGHTHNIQDQRFATAATALSGADTLETPEEFQRRLQHRAQPTCSNIPCFVEIVEATFDWTGWLRGLGCGWHGHTSNVHTKAATCVEYCFWGQRPPRF